MTTTDIRDPQFNTGDYLVDRCAAVSEVHRLRRRVRILTLAVLFGVAANVTLTLSGFTGAAGRTPPHTHRNTAGPR